jgi:hypothetical protein
LAAGFMRKNRETKNRFEATMLPMNLVVAALLPVTFLSIVAHAMTDRIRGENGTLSLLVAVPLSKE